MDSFLKQNERARYSVILVGGGSATECEYNETQSVLGRQFGERVQIIPLVGGGGLTERLIKSQLPNNVSPIEARGKPLRDKLVTFNDEIPRLERERQPVAELHRKLNLIISAKQRLEDITQTTTLSDHWTRIAHSKS